MKRLISALFAGGVLLAGSPAVSQQINKPAGKKELLKQPAQVQQIQKHKNGDYGRLPRSTLGAINRNWSERCSESHTIQRLVYDANKEIRVRLVQTIGTVITFPEPVTAITSGLGNDTIVVESFPKKQETSRIWVLGAKKAGADTNVTFIGGATDADPRFYAIHTQLEGWNTLNCPDVIVKISGAIGSSARTLAKQAHDILRYGNNVIGSAKVAPVEMIGIDDLDEASRSQSQANGAGRQEVDYLKGEGSDPAKLDFRWLKSGDIDEADFGPDIIYSDETHMYLQWAPERRKKILMPAVAVVLTTDKGKVDTPILPTMRGNTMVVPRVANLTLKLEGIIICITHEETALKSANVGS